MAIHEQEFVRDLSDENKAFIAKVAELEARVQSEKEICFEYIRLHGDALNRVADLETLLRELIDIEGPQPGHVERFVKVRTALGICGVCGKSMPPLEQWSMPACPKCTDAAYKAEEGSPASGGADGG